MSRSQSIRQLVRQLCSSIVLKNLPGVAVTLSQARSGPHRHLMQLQTLFLMAMLHLIAYARQNHIIHTFTIRGKRLGKRYV